MLCKRYEVIIELQVLKYLNFQMHAKLDVLLGENIKAQWCSFNCFLYI